MKSTVVKVFVGFLIGAVSVGGFAVANTPSVPVVKACMTTKVKLCLSLQMELCQGQNRN
jgi:putative serine protease PepD